MFGRIQGLLETLFTDMQETFIWLFIIGIAVCAVIVAFGDEESTPKFKKGIKICIAGLVVFLLARPIIEYIDTNL